MNGDDLPRLYGDLAELWPLISPPSDYAAEMAVIRQLLDEHLGSAEAAAPKRILELGAGGGHGLWHLADDFDCTAVDLAPAMLAHCHELNPDMETHVGDMRSVRLEKKFDVVLIHDAIDYMTTARDAQDALQTAAVHLDVGGLLIVVPTYVRETFVQHELAHDHQQVGPVELTYFSYVHDPDPHDTAIELVLVYLIGGDDAAVPLRIEHDRHVCGLFATDAWLDMIKEVGFTAETRPNCDAAGTVLVGVRR
jgi:SAM-dependent methyltransferase